MKLKVLAIRTDFGHHGEYFGYKQILKYTHPHIVLGIDERSKTMQVNRLKLNYPWLFEFEAYKLRKEIDLVHILYGEDYLRWSTKLFKNTPVVATFHQPPAILEREVRHGDYRGRVGRYTHLLTKDRFEKLSAAIVTNPAQAQVLKKVMPESKIHYIPLGLHLDNLNLFYERRPNDIVEKSIITVGNWQRDWDFYFRVVEKCPHYNFVLVNRNLERSIVEKTKGYSNLKYYSDVSDTELFELYLNSKLQFLPVLGIAGSNAFLQGLSLGCPVVLTNINSEQPNSEPDFIRLYETDSVEDAVKQIDFFISLNTISRRSIQHLCNKYANQFSWEEVANKTTTLYEQLI